MLTVSYDTDRGASVLRRVEPEHLESFLARLRRPAKVFRNGVKIGEVEAIEKGVADDRRIRWNWWYDQKEIENEKRAPDAGQKKIGGKA